jgi:asparagine synthase (glutamine-hydrolysing)
MCGFAGYIDARAATPKRELEAAAVRMAEVLRHRGPDDDGAWADPGAGVAFAHRRLSIVDLSAAGHQPMLSSTGRFVIVYNGEIYNCEELRRSLQSEERGLRFRGHSDTEVMLAAFDLWGVESSLERLNGMFAFALWDRRDQVLWLARDRFGEKPLYYGWAGQNFLFGSELKSLRAHGAFDAEIDRDTLADYLRFNCIPAPETIYRGIRKLSPASLLCYSGGEIQVKSYWSLRTCVQRGIAEPFRGSASDACNELDHLLRDSIRMRMYADVPVGAFLSGGIDSSVLVALMQAQASKPVRTFSIGFHDPAYDESKDARAIARHLGTEHTELQVTCDQAMGLLNGLPETYDEPFADSSQIPTLLVSQLTRRHVTVSLSGDGGDEMFGGYNRYAWGGKLWNQFSRVPHFLRRGLGAVIGAVGPQIWDAVFEHAGSVLPKSWQPRMPGHKVHKLADLLRSTDSQNMYARMSSHWFQPESVVMGAEQRPPAILADDQWLGFGNFEQQAMYLDTITYLPNDILVKLDRATMAFGLEGRVPFLDPRIVEFAWSLPQNMKLRPNESKWILRQVLDRYAPRQLMDRPKMGFGIPLGSWLRGPMRDWAEALLDEDRLRQEGFFRPETIRQKWNDHLSGRGAWQYHLWDILMFQLWLEHQKLDPKMERTSEVVRVGV